MIIEFSVQNFRSIDDIQTLSFVSTGLKSAREYSYIDDNNFHTLAGTPVFHTVGIYGANASGKSNMVKALDAFVKVITGLPSAVSNLGELTQPFLFQPDADSTESFFQMVFILGDVKYRYGLTVKKDLNERNSNQGASGEVITNEWLFSNKGKNMSPVFIRQLQKITKNSLPNKAKIPQELPYNHTLFLSHVAAFDTTGECKRISDHFRAYFTSDYEIKHDKFRWMSMIHLDDDLESKNRFKQLLAAFNLKYDDILLDQEAEHHVKNVFPQEKISLIKSYRTGEGFSTVNLNLKFHESSGTQKMFDLAGLLLLTFGFSHPAFIILDEIDSNFHPSLLIRLIGLFNDPEINRSKSQLLFTSHDTNLLSPAIMRRDQFYLTEKNEQNSTRLYSLADLKGIRNDADFAKQYLAGYYGGLPVLQNYCDNPNLRSDEQ